MWPDKLSSLNSESYISVNQQVILFFKSSLQVLKICKEAIREVCTRLLSIYNLFIGLFLPLFNKIFKIPSTKVYFESILIKCLCFPNDKNKKKIRNILETNEA